MKAAVYRGPADHQNAHAAAMAAGLQRHNINIEFFRQFPTGDFDFAVTWGWRNGKHIQNKTNKPVLIMERGFFDDRFSWTSLGWNGLNGRADWNKAGDNGERFEKNFAHLAKDWRVRNDGYALIMGQVKGDAALAGVNIENWYGEAAEHMKALGFDVRFREHPIARRRGGGRPPMKPVTGDLLDNLKDAAVVVTFNSNSGVDAAINGVPVIAYDKGSMAWPIAAHGFTREIITPDRADWFVDMSWRQWRIDEIASGFVWEYIKDVPFKATGKSENKKNKIALVLGGGKEVWQEAQLAFKLANIDYVIATNQCIADYPGEVDIAITLHTKQLSDWLAERERKGFPAPRKIVGHNNKYNNVDQVLNYRWPGMKYSGSTGHFGAKAAIEILGCDKVMLAGVPMSQRSNHYYSEKPWKDCEMFLPAWKHSLPYIEGKVKSFSGFTASLLGVPTEEWLKC